ncbi:MAG: hypothetical protein EOL97_13200 [Spirochaetia bacterium]|nr:hypothetical protein [Spirochaetia bacterium]
MKNKHKRDITRKSLIYSIGTIVASITSVLILPLYSNYIKPSDYGSYEYAFSFVQLFIAVGFFEISSTMLRFMYGIEQESEDTKKTAIYSGAIIHLGCTILLAFAVIITNKVTFLPFAPLVFLFGVSFTTATYFLSIARGLDKEKIFTLAFSIYSVVNIIILSFLLIKCKLGAKSIFIALCSAHIIEIIYLEFNIHFFKNFKIKYIKFSLIKKMLKFSLPLALASFGTWIMLYYSSIKIVNLIGPEQNGYYTMAMNFARAIPTIATGAILAWQEIAFSKRGSEIEKNVFFSNAIEKVIYLLCSIYIIMVPLDLLIIPFYLGASYQGINTIISICVAGTTIDCFSLFLASIYGNQINSKPLMVSTSLGAITVFLLLPLMIKHFGIMGAAITNGLGFFINAFFRLTWLTKINKYRYNYFKIIIWIIVAIIIGFISANTNTIGYLILLIFGLLFAYPAIKLMINFKSNKNMQNISI